MFRPPGSSLVLPTGRERGTDRPFFKGAPGVTLLLQQLRCNVLPHINLPL